MESEEEIPKQMPTLSCLIPVFEVDPALWILQADNNITDRNNDNAGAFRLQYFFLRKIEQTHNEHNTNLFKVKTTKIIIHNKKMVIASYFL